MIRRSILALLSAATLLPSALSAQQMTVAMVEDMDLAAPELPAGGDIVRVENRLDERFVDFVIGPLDLPADMGHLRPPIQVAEIPVDGWLQGFEFEARQDIGRLILGNRHGINDLLINLCRFILLIKINQSITIKNFRFQIHSINLVLWDFQPYLNNFVIFLA